MNLYDQHYRQLFSSPHMVRALFEGILPPALLAMLDLDTLEPLPSTFVSAKLRDRRGDLIWRIRRRDGTQLYVLLLLEHQSKPERIMSVRIMGYAALLYEDLVKRDLLSPSDPLPLLLPIVLYSGEARWNAPLQVSELVCPAPAILQPFQPNMSYLLLDMGALVAQGGLPDDNLAAIQFKLEHNQGIEQTRELLQTLLRLTRRPEYRSLRRVFGSWMRAVILPRSAPKLMQYLPESDDLQEIKTMLTSYSRDWEGQLLHKGEQKGRQEGAAGVLQRQLERRFGQLSKTVQQRLHSASTEQLDQWSLNVLDAETLEQVFDSPA